MRGTGMQKISLNGTCAICQSPVSKTSMKKHLQTCLEASGKNAKGAGKPKAPVKLFHLLVEGYGLSEDLYWIASEGPGQRELSGFG